MNNPDLPNHMNSKIEDEVNSHIENLFRTIIQQTNTCAENNIVSKALLCLLVRCANTWRSVRTLRIHTPDKEGFGIDAGTLLRAMLDAYFQAEYIAKDSSVSEERAKNYFEFEHIERYKQMEKFLSYNNWLSQRLKASPKRQFGEENVRREFDRVKAQYPTNSKKSGVRSHWYPGNLYEIASSLGRKEEYELFLSRLNGCVHSSASAVLKGPPASPEHVLDWASTVAARVAQLSVLHNNLELEDLYKKMLDQLCKSHF